MAIRRRRRAGGVRGGSRRRTGRRIRGVTSVQFRRPAPAALTRPFRGRRIPVLGKRRNFAPARTTVKRRKTVKDSGAYSQLQSYKFTKTLGHLTRKKRNFVQTGIVVTEWRNYRRLENYGALQMFHYQDTVAKVSKLPMYIWELNTNPVHSSPAPVCYTPTRNEANYTWNQQNGLDQSTGAQTVNTWVSQMTGNQASGTQVGRALWRWGNYKFDLYGCKNQATRYRLSLVQFKDDDWVIDGTQTTDAIKIAFWDRFFRKLVFDDTICEPAPGFQNPIKLVWTKDVEIQPTASTQTDDDDPHIKNINLFFRMNRRCDFMWRYGVQSVATNNNFETNVAFDTLSNTEVLNRVDPKARMYLMVTALNMHVLNAAPAASDTTYTPTFNCYLRNSWLVK